MAPIADLPAAAGVVDLSFRRVLPAPRARVWAAWTEPAMFAMWFGPHGFDLDPCRIDARVGGELFFCHRHPSIGEVWVRGEFIVVEPPSRLVILFGFADADGETAVREGFAASTRIEVMLAEHAAGTEMRIRHTGLARDQGEGEGWKQSLERLNTLLTPHY
jgi:uncharacterized protein YndB with AHSA1/START domain